MQGALPRFLNTKTGRSFALGSLMMLPVACARNPRPIETAAPIAPKADAAISVRDLTPQFDSFWRSAKAEDDAARVRRFKAEVVPIFPEYYAYRFGLWAHAGKNVDTELAAQLRAFESLEPQYARLELPVRQMLQTSIVEFRRAFPDFHPSAELGLLYTLGEMDGGARFLGHHAYLLFGLDGIAKYHSAADQKPFFSHELFHVYQDDVLGHDRTKEDSLDNETKALPEPLYARLWGEGLATYVSEWLNPGASKAAMLLEVPKELVPEAEKNLPYLASDLLSKLDSHKVDDDHAYFSLGSAQTDPRRPHRAGYYVGYLVAKKLHARIEMPSLVRLDGAPLRREIAAVLTEIAVSGSRPSSG